jgi:hypothetical protein
MRRGEADPVRRSVEVEYWVVDEDGWLTDPGALVDAAPGAEGEFVEPLLEIKTTPCTTTAELRTELFSQLDSVLRRAEDLGKRLVPLATPLGTAAAEPIRDRPSERTEIQDHVVGPEFEYVRHCAGTHIHVEQQPGRAIDQLNTLIALDPALALANSARHFNGTPIAAGARSKCYRWLAYDGLDHQGRLWPYVTDRAEWDRRLQARYEEFLAAAERAGWDRATVADCFDPESAVWTPVQLRDAFDTVEWRSPDATLPSEIIRLADSMATTVEHLRDVPVRVADAAATGDGVDATAGRTTGRADAPGRIDDDEIVLPPFEVVTDHVERAVRDGLAADSLRAYLSRMGFAVDDYDPLAAEAADWGTLTPRAARRLRLEYADRLRTDVVQRAPMEAD